MEKEKLYGKRLYANRPKKAGTIAKLIFIIVSMIFTILLAMISIFGLILTEDYVPGMVFLILSMSLLFLLVFGLVKKWYLPLEINFFEHGVTLTRGSEITEYDFKDLDGVQVSEVKIRQVGIGSIRNKTLTIFPNERKPIHLNISRFQEELCYLDTLYTNYITSNLNKGNINNKIIKFGKYIELNNSKFIHKRLKKEIPLESVIGIIDDHGIITLQGKNDSFSLVDSQRMNFNILYYIIYKMNEES